MGELTYPTLDKNKGKSWTNRCFGKEYVSSLQGKFKWNAIYSSISPDFGIQIACVLLEGFPYYALQVYCSLQTFENCSLYAP